MGSNNSTNTTMECKKNIYKYKTQRLIERQRGKNDYLL